MCNGLTNIQTIKNKNSILTIYGYISPVNPNVFNVVSNGK
jgi:hypothetical protein